MQRLSIWTRYVAAIGIVAMTVLALDWLVSLPHYPYLFLILPVVASALLGGIGPGLLAMSLGLLAGNYYFSEPRFQFSFDDPDDLLHAIHYLVIGGITVFLIQLIHVERERTAVAMAAARLRARRAELEVEERKRVEDALRQSQQRLQLALEAGRMGTWDWDIRSGKVTWSAALEAIHGLPAGTFKGTFEDFKRDIHPDDRDQVIHRINSVLKDGGDYLNLYRIIRPDGKVTWLETQGQMRRDAEGNPSRMTGICMDVTQRKLSEEALQRSERRYRALLDAYSECVWIWNPATNEGDRNGVRWWMELTGQPREQMRNDGWMNAVLPDDRPRARSKWVDAMNNGTLYDDELRVLAKDGSIRHVQSRAVPIKDATGKLLEWCGTLVDVTNQRRAEQALKLSEQRLNAVLASIDDHLVTYDSNWRLTYVNEKAAAVLGKPSEELLGKCIWDLKPDARGSQYLQELNLAYAEQRALRSEHYDVTSDKWFENHIYPTSDGVTVFASDITWRKNAQKALRESEERFRLALKAAPIMIFTYDRDLRYTWAYNIHPSYSVEQLIGRTDAEVVPGEVGEHLMRIKRRVLETGHGAREEVQIELDGQLCTFDLMLEPMRDAQAQVVGVTVAAVDISQRKQMEEALSASEREFRAFFDLAATGKIQCDAATFRLLRVNRKFQETLAYENAELLTKTIFELLHPEDRPQCERQLHELAAGRTKELQKEARLLRKDGQTVWATLSVSVIRNQKDAAVRMIASVQDITERKMFELELTRHREELEAIVAERTQELERSHQRLRLSERMNSMGTLSAGLAHDMGNLVLPMKMRLDVLQAMNLPDVVREHVGAIEHCAKHLQGLVQGLRLFSRDPDPNGYGDNTQLSEWHRDTRAFFMGLMPPNISLTFDIPPQLPAVGISAHALTQIGLNLLNNARESIGPERPGRVLMKACASPDRKTVCLIVQDDGPGMTAQVRSRAVEPFFTTKKRSLSTGLGLSMVHGLVTAVGGELEIHSPLGNEETERAGAAITLILPAVEVESMPEKIADDLHSRLAAVSIADQRTCAIVSTLLTSMGYDVRQMSNGQPGACDVWVTEPADDRYGPVQTVIEARPDTRIIVVGEAPDSWRQLPVHFIPGPCRPSALRAALSAKSPVELSSV